jgi:hypothetical protein
MYTINYNGFLKTLLYFLLSSEELSCLFLEQKKSHHRIACQKNDYKTGVGDVLIGQAMSSTVESQMIDTCRMMDG